MELEKKPYMEFAVENMIPSLSHLNQTGLLGTKHV